MAQLTSDYDDQYLVFNGERVTWYRPTSLGQLLEVTPSQDNNIPIFVHDKHTLI